MPQSYASLHVHMIFSTKHRKPTMDPKMQPRLFEYMGGILRAKSGCLVAAGGVPDHVHLLASLSRTISVSDAIRDIKSNSSGWVHKNFPRMSAFHWQDGYGAFSVSHSNLWQVKNYLANQEAHHRTLSFKEEFLEFLVRHDIEYDERYLWD